MKSALNTFIYLLLVVISLPLNLFGQSNDAYHVRFGKRPGMGAPVLRDKLHPHTQPSNSLYVKMPQQRTCETMVDDAELRAKYPELGTPAQFEARMAQLVAAHRHDLESRHEIVLTIPVVVHVVHNGEAVGAGANISQAQIMSQIDVLNEDYRRTGAGFNNHPSGADVEIQFAMAVVDPQGNPLAEPGIHRVNGNRPAWERQAIQDVLKPNTQWDPNRYMNMWTVVFGGNDVNLLGYAQFPSLSGLQGFQQNEGAAQTDGVVIRYNSFGRIGNIEAPYNGGRTATHEVGHWLGLRHIWGDGDCSADDFCADTPNSDHPNYQCAAINSCPDGASDMIENYMDYTPDDCMNIVTNDQKTRIRTVLQVSPRRKELTTSTVHMGGGGNPGIPNAVFTVNTQNICTGSTVQFIDQSTNNPTSWQWAVLDGANNVLATFTGQSQTITFNTEGVYSLRLTVSNANGNSSRTEKNYITVLSSTGPAEFQENFENTANLLPDWVVYNPDADRSFSLSNVSAYGLGSHSIMFDNYSTDDDPTGTIDALVTPRINLTNVSNPYIYFEHAYAQYGGQYTDTLVLLYSTNCGQTFTPFFVLGGEDLATAPPTENFFVPSSNQWSWKQVSLDFLSGQSNVHIAVANLSGWGNNLYLDQIAFIDGDDYTNDASDPDFATSHQVVCAGDYVSYVDYSSNFPTVWNWQFEGGSPSSSTQQHPNVYYNSPGLYDVALFAGNSLGGSIITAPSYIQVLPLPSVDVSVNANIICPGEPVTFTATGADEYEWYDDRGTIIATGEQVTAVLYENIVFTLVGYSDAGCNSSETFLVEVTQALTPSISVQGTVLTSSQALAYQWYFNGQPIPAAAGGNQQSLLAQTAGNYAVEVLYASGCTAVSNEIFFNPSTGIDPRDVSHTVNAFPNPTTGDITVRMDNDLQGDFVLQLTNYLGQEVLRQEASKQGNQWELTLQMTDLPTGCYQLTITNELYSAVKKIVKR